MVTRYTLFSLKKNLLYAGGMISICMVLASWSVFESDWVFCALPLSIPFFVLGKRFKSPVAEMENGRIRIIDKNQVQAEFDLACVVDWKLHVGMWNGKLISESSSHSDHDVFSDASVKCIGNAGMDAEFIYSDNEKLFAAILVYLSRLKTKPELKELANSFPAFEAEDKLIRKVFAAWREQ